MTLAGSIAIGAIMVAGSFSALARSRARSRDRRFRTRDVPADLPHREWSKFFSADGARIHFQDAGRGDPLILLHGFGASTVCWSFVLPALTPSCRVIVPDLMGFGLSDAPRESAYSLHSHATVVARLLDHLAISGATVCGNSLGGAVALTLALIRPDLVSRLVLLAPAVTLARRERWLIRMLRVRGVGEFVGALVGAVSWFVKLEMRRIYYRHETTVTPTRLHLYHRSLATASTQYGALTTLRQWRLSELDEFLPEISQPATLLWGDHDRVLPVSLGRGLAERLPCAQLRVIERCGHSPEEEHPDLVIREIRAIALAAAVPEFAVAEEGR